VEVASIWLLLRTSFDEFFIVLFLIERDVSQFGFLPDEELPPFFFLFSLDFFRGLTLGGCMYGIPEEAGTSEYGSPSVKYFYQ
jgi:hypothetical protein